MTTEMHVPLFLVRELARLQWGRGLVTTEMTRKRAEFADVCALQWGRGLVTTEICQPGIRLAPPRLASMGPWPGDHGNMGGPDRDCGGFGALQWGRGLVTTEIQLRLQKGIEDLGFNGAVAW